ncbi:DUF6966 domain-containing protein [Citrobacter sp. Awk 2]|uniref:DUF6966 domain-containing protein n=1 Tax=Citrobacter sp. Awk 2 TaxID=2963959 RepID=UPI003FA4A25B
MWRQHSLKGLYAGMGSFNDVILHTNGMPLIRENDNLDYLNHRNTPYRCQN